MPTQREEVTAWLHRQAVPLERACDVDCAGDLESLKNILHGVDIVGFADSTHGTKEFFELRHRVLRFLVEEMGFRNLVIEASYSATQVVNDYVVHGIGDKSAALTGLQFAMWDVEEFSRVLDWLRDYNASAEPDGDKVHLFGVDIWNTRISRERVLAYLRTVASTQVESASRLFTQIGRSEARGPLLAAGDMDTGLLQGIHELSTWFAENELALVARTSPDAYDDTLRHVLAVSQWISANVVDKLATDMVADNERRAPELDNYVRSAYMAENLLHLVQHARPSRKTVVWGHLFHLGIGFTDPVRGPLSNMGHHLRERFGRRYYVFALEFDRGTYLARRWLPGCPLGEFETVTLTPALADSLPWWIAQTGGPAQMLDLRPRQQEPVVERWLAAPQLMHTVSWCHRESPWLYTELQVGTSVDGILFVETTSATTPTMSARGNISSPSYH